MPCPYYRKLESNPVCGALPEQFLSPVLPERKLFCESLDEYRTCKIYQAFAKPEDASIDPLKAAEMRFKKTMEERNRVMGPPKDRKKI